MFELLSTVYGDAQMAQVFGERRTVEQWLTVEAALARAQAAVGVLDEDDARAIADAARVDDIDLAALWSTAKTVGYPILGLVRQLAARLPDGPDGHVHYGATTQDIMDTALALQLGEAADLLTARVGALGDAVARLVDEHRATLMPGRTHGQQAVPTTFGAHLAPSLTELLRARRRLAAARHDAAVVSLYGAGGTSAALGPQAAEVRRTLAEILGLRAVDVSWHASRDGVVAFAQAATLVAGACARLARNVIDLSRTEIGEVREADGKHRGASSTMPQKANPILAEGIVGMSTVVGALCSSLQRSLEVPQERAAGEWHVEWFALPHLLTQTASALRCTTELVGGLHVDADAMRTNLDADNGLVMAEAYMIALAPALGRELAHDVVYAAARDVRANGQPLVDAVRRRLAADGAEATLDAAIEPADYVGDAVRMCATALDLWTSSTKDRATA
ncbi:MAG: 3-carboxy-cis,cis-muconate cycloisomerase [Streptosporangiales bacterium]|nr:3-carboxy-cis,cis-muconate cycloisomerase [Streptosporangiales bacterium]